MSGDCARKVVAMGLEKGFVQIQLGSLVKIVALVYVRKRKDAKNEITIVSHCQVLRLLNEICLCTLSDFIFNLILSSIKYQFIFFDLRVFNDFERKLQTSVCELHL